LIETGANTFGRAFGWNQLQASEYIYCKQLIHTSSRKNISRQLPPFFIIADFYINY
jgi:hypothetical protein